MTIAAALVAEDEAAPHNGGGLVRAQGSGAAMSERLLDRASASTSARGYVVIGSTLDCRRSRRSACPAYGVALEEALRPDTVEIKLELDKRARFERDQRRRGGEGRASDYARPR